MAFKSLFDRMGELNSAYYKSPKTKIYDDFLTYAHSEKGMLTKANATDFYSRVKNKSQSQFQIIEIGVGNGAFAKGFLDEIKELDKKNSTAVASKIIYTLADFSKPVLERAKKFNEDFQNHGKLNSYLFDASLSDCKLCGEFSDKISGLVTYDLIRCNELFSDLPSQLYVKIEDEIFLVYFDEKLSPQLQPTVMGDLSELELKLIHSLPNGYFIPINRSAANSISFLSNHLKKGAFMDIFDYGFYLTRDFDIPADMWNLSIVREYNTQWTVDLNFIYLAALMQSLEKSSSVQPQKDYVQKITGKKLSLSNEKSLDYSLEVSEFEEDDSFYHLRVSNGV